jgi:hypothetical protein
MVDVFGLWLLQFAVVKKFSLDQNLISKCFKAEYVKSLCKNKCSCCDLDKKTLFLDGPVDLGGLYTTIGVEEC